MVNDSEGYVMMYYELIVEIVEPCDNYAVVVEINSSLPSQITFLNQDGEDTEIQLFQFPLIGCPWMSQNNLVLES